MTDGQIRFQTLMENQRHNLEMERYAKQEQESKRISAEASAKQAAVAQQQADTRQSELALEERKNRVANWKYVRSTGERVYKAVQNIWGNGFSFLGNVINAIKGVGQYANKSLFD